MKNKLLLIICIMLLTVLCIVSCKDQPKQPSELPEATSETAQETESEPGEPDLDLEIAQNYTNTVVSAQVAIEYVKKADEQCRTQHKSDLSTYYNAVKALGSTGKNTSDSFYDYEWVLDDGTYLHGKFHDIYDDDGQLIRLLEQKGEVVPANAVATLFIDDYTEDPDLIKSNYPDYSTYLYEIFFTDEFESYDEFFRWFGYKELPEVEDIGCLPYTPENVDIIRKRLTNRIVLKERALNIKPGMTVYEAINFIGSHGEGNAEYYHEWVVDSNFRVWVGITYETPPYEQYQRPYEGIIFTVEYHTANPASHMYR